MIPVLWLAALFAASQDQPAISVAPDPGKGYTLTIGAFPADEMPALLERMKVVADKRCGALAVRWGRYHYDTAFDRSDPSGRALMVNYRQAFNCIDPATDPYKPVADDWTASAQDDADVLAFAERYMATFDAADVDAGLPMMESIFEIDRATWLEQPRALHGIMGSGTRTFRGPYWQRNPETAGHPGAYAGLVFRGNYSGLAFYCGTLLVYRDGPGVYHVSQQSVRAVPKEAVASGKVSAAAAAKACEDY